MTQKIIVNGISYDSPDAMPPDVRRQYDNALRLMKDVKQGTVQNEALKKTVTTFPGGVSINVEERQVKYSIDGKTYDDLADLPPELRAQVERALGAASSTDVRDLGRTDVRVANVEIARTHRGRWILWWLLVAAIAALIFGILLPEP